MVRETVCKDVKDGLSPCSISCTTAGWPTFGGWATHQGQASQMAHVSLCLYNAETYIVYIIYEIRKYCDYWLAKNDQLFYPIFIENWGWVRVLHFSLLPVITLLVSKRTQGPKVIAIILGEGSLSCSCHGETLGHHPGISYLWSQKCTLATMLRGQFHKHWSLTKC